MVEPLKHISNDELEKKNGVNDEMDVQTSPKVVRERTRSLNAPSPIQQFGPCGRIMKNSAMVMTIQDPASQRLTWYKPPLTVLVIKKVRDALVIPPFISLCKWFINQKRMVVFVVCLGGDGTLLYASSLFQQSVPPIMAFHLGSL